MSLVCVYEIKSTGNSGKKKSDVLFSMDVFSLMCELIHFFVFSTIYKTAGRYDIKLSDILKKEVK